jgi:hypothetical protein
MVRADAGVAQSLGTIPAGSVILKPASGVAISEVFTAGDTSSAAVVDIGSAADDDLFATNLGLDALGFVPCDEAVSFYVAADTELTATIGVTGTVTGGVAKVVVAYVPNNGNNTREG